MFKKSVPRIIVFLIALACLLAATIRVLDEKAEVMFRYDRLHAMEENTVDLLILGSSHAYCGFYTNVFWTEKGYAAYVLGGNKQTLWESYHALVDALETQTPKLIILEGYGLSFSRMEYEEMSLAYVNTHSMRLSKNKAEAIRDSIPEDKRADAVLRFPVVHGKYSFLTRNDFDLTLPYPENKGTECLRFAMPFAPPVAPAGAQPMEPLPKAETYFRKILDLVRERNIPLMIVISPFIYNYGDYEILLTEKQIAEEYGVPFLNGNELYDEMGINFGTMMADDTHLNYLGGPLFTRYIADYIAAHYDLPDRRGDPKYASWDADAGVLQRRIYNRSSQDVHYLKELLASYADESYATIVAFSGKSTDADLGLEEIMQAMNLAPVGAGGVRCVSGGEILASALPGEVAYLPMGKDMFFFDSHKLTTSEVENTVLYAGEPVLEEDEPEKNGLTITVYDRLLNETVVSVITWKDNGYNGFQFVE